MRERAWRRRAVLLGVAGATTALARATRAAPARLTLATGAVPPLVSGAQQVGFLNALAEDVFRRVGVEVSLQAMPLERELMNANAGIEDGVMLRAPGFEKDYPNLMRVPEKVMDFHLVAYTTRPDLQVRNWAELARHSVAYITGWKMVEVNLKGAADVTTVRSPDQLLALLGAGRVDAVVLGRWHTLLQRGRATGIPVRALEPPLSEIPMYLWLHRRHEALVQPLAAAMAQSKSDGTWQRLYDQILKPLEGPR